MRSLRAAGASGGHEFHLTPSDSRASLGWPALRHRRKKFTCSRSWSEDLQRGLWSMQRIVILGNAGSGKSTLAREMGERLHLPVVHLDKLFWGPGWSKPQNEVFRARVSEALSGDRWVCEGNYRQTFDLRLPRADLVVWLNTPRATCLRRVVLRSVLNRPRPDLPTGCSEKLDAEFLSFLRYVWNFDRDTRPSIEEERLAKGPLVPMVSLRGARQISEFVSSLAR